MQDVCTGNNAKMNMLEEGIGGKWRQPQRRTQCELVVRHIADANHGNIPVYFEGGS